MAAKKNKKAKKPAVGNPAAGSNNKRDKKGSQPAKKANNNSKGSQKNKEQQRKEAELRNKQKQEAAKKAAEKAAKEKERQKKEAEIRNKQKQEAAKKAAEKAAKEKERQKKEAEFRKQQKQEAEKKAAEKAAKELRNKQKSEKKTENKKEKIKKKIFLPSFIKNIKQKLSGRKLIYAIAAVAVVIATAVLIIVFVSGRNYPVPDKVKNAEFKGRMAPESVAFDIDISENQQKALAKATDARGDGHKFDFFINDEIVMNEYDDPALIEFGSLSSNKCVLMFYILDENGNELYRSLGVDPGKQIRSVTFFDEIAYGTHDVTVAVLGYDAETYKKIGMQTTKIKLKIGVE